jgi:hypothetical protein
VWSISSSDVTADKRLGDKLTEMTIQVTRTVRARPWVSASQLHEATKHLDDRIVLTAVFVALFF